eukprot:comp21777_c0_seq1/m.48774 comp21777_c0_seq1/g.48774  ORF comp21777_c0_seq1/g.48774 comp21777_c0_seq1/m.48774 type:complete len:366 (-) comp21777_c0_seq1:126-1223(-)
MRSRRMGSAKVSRSTAFWTSATGPRVKRFEVISRSLSRASMSFHAWMMSWMMRGCSESEIGVTWRFLSSVARDTVAALRTALGAPKGWAGSRMRMCKNERRYATSVPLTIILPEPGTGVPMDPAAWSFVIALFMFSSESKQIHAHRVKSCAASGAESASEMNPGSLRETMWSSSAWRDTGAGTCGMKIWNTETSSPSGSADADKEGSAASVAVAAAAAATWSGKSSGENSGSIEDLSRNISSSKVWLRKTGMPFGASEDKLRFLYPVRATSCSWESWLCWRASMRDLSLSKLAQYFSAASLHVCAISLRVSSSFSGAYFSRNQFSLPYADTNMSLYLRAWSSLYVMYLRSIGSSIAALAPRLAAA